MKEKVSLFCRFRTPDGEPTCSTKNDALETCALYYSMSFGQKEYCFFNGYKLDRGGDGTGYLKPHAHCPFWQEGVEIAND